MPSGRRPSRLPCRRRRQARHALPGAVRSGWRDRERRTFWPADQGCLSTTIVISSSARRFRGSLRAPLPRVGILVAVNIRQPCRHGTGRRGFLQFRESPGQEQADMRLRRISARSWFEQGTGLRPLLCRSLPQGPRPVGRSDIQSMAHERGKAGRRGRADCPLSVTTGRAQAELPGADPQGPAERNADLRLVQGMHRCEGGGTGEEIAVATGRAASWTLGAKSRACRPQPGSTITRLWPRRMT